MLANDQGLIVQLSRTIPSPKPQGRYRPADANSNRHLVSDAKARTINCQLAFAALADPTRWAVFERTLNAPRPVCAIAAGLPVSRAAVSQHLKVLKEAGLITCRRDGSRHLYRADPWRIGELVSAIDTLWREAMKTSRPRGPEGER